MNSLNLGSEPVAIVGTVDSVLIGVQQLAIPMSSGLHAAVAIVLVILGTILARSGVTPNAKAASSATQPPAV